MKTCIILVWFLSGTLLIGKTASELDAEIVKMEQKLAQLKSERATLVDGSHSSETEPKSGIDPVVNRLKKASVSVRKSALDKNAIQEPATFQLTIPSNGKDFYSIDLGVTWDVATFLSKPSVGNEESVPNIAFGPLIEYHRDTQIAKPKDTLQAGAVFSGIFGNDVSDSKAIGAVVTGQAKYKRDGIANSDGALILGEISPLVARNALLPFPIGGTFGPEELKLIVQPRLGLGFESASTVRNLGRSGDTLRAKGMLETVVYPFAETLSKRLEVVGRITWWGGFGESGGFKTVDDSESLFEASVNYYFGPMVEEDETFPFAIGLDYVNGTNPEENLLDNEFWRF